jgi:predicted metalloprotease
MTFRRRVRLNPGQVRDMRGKGGLALGGGLGGVILLVAILLLGGDPSQIPMEALNGITVGAGQDNSQLEQECQTGEDANQRQDCRIVGFVNAIQEYWGTTLNGYEQAPTTFFTGQVGTGCGTATSAVGPFYCPEDRNVYIDLGFFDQLEGQLGAEGGPLAEAYVLAHEYGHHVQNLTGVLRGGGGGTGAESRSVRTELQADCYAGAFINHAEERYLEPVTSEQVAQALDAARAVGDDRIQERTQGQVDPETWTHGASEQRQRWFTVGWESGDPSQCDTFNTDNL